MNRQILVDDWKTFASEMPPIDGSESLIGIPYDFIVVAYYGKGKLDYDDSKYEIKNDKYTWRSAWDGHPLEEYFGNPIHDEWVWQKIHFPKCVPIRKHQ